MEELTPIYNDQSLLMEEEMSMSLFSPTNPNRILLLLLPIAFLFLLRPKDVGIYSHSLPSPTPRKESNRSTGTPLNFDGDTIDKMRLMLDGLKKAQTIQGLRKTMSRSGGQNPINLEMMKELLDVAGNTLGDNTKSQIKNISNMLSMVDKMKDFKKIMDVQKAVKNENTDGDTNSQINNMIDLIGPMLPKEQAKNIESFKKMAQMMKFMSVFEGSDDDNISENELEDSNEIQ